MRSKQEIRKWDNRIGEMLTADVETALIENRIRSIRYLLKSEHSEIINNNSKEDIIQFIRDAIYLDRKMRLFTEGIEEQKKKQSSDEFIVNEL